MISLKALKRQFPYELLGRSLAANAFYPNSLYDGLKNGLISSFLLLDKKHFLSKSECKNLAFYSFDLEELSFFRRYNQAVLIYARVLKDEHELLLALVFGCDVVVLSDIKLVLKARYFGLDVIFKAKKDQDLKEELIIYTDDESLIQKLPPNSIIISNKLLANSFHINTPL